MIKKIIAAVIMVTVFLGVSRYGINSMFEPGIAKNKSRIFVMENKVKLWKAKLKKAEKSKAADYKKLITWASMRKVELQLENVLPGFLVEEWIIKLAYIGIREKLQKGFFTKKLNSFLYKKVKDISCEGCSEKYQDCFKMLIGSLKEGDQKKTFELSDQLGKIYKEQTKLVENLVTVKKGRIKFKLN
jgi:hypothetical protein